MYHLYYSAGSCSMAIHIALREMGMEMGRDFDLIDTSLNAGKNRSAEFLALNPRGQVPVLVEDGQAIREGGAILVYLLDKHQSALLPREGFARAQALQALMWGNATMHPAYSRYFWLSRNVQDEAQRQALLTAAANNIQSLWDDADQQLAKTAFLAGDTLTMGDILMAVIANWSTSLIQPIQFGEHVKRVIRQVISRPAYQAALAAESVEYKVIPL